VFRRALIDISCTSPSLCVGVDERANVFTSTAPTRGRGAWSRAIVQDVAGFGGVSCASASLCVAGGYFGVIATSLDPPAGGQSWNVAQISSGEYGSREPTRISCPSPSLCVALGFRGGPGHADRIFSSSEPTGGAEAWRIVDVHANHLTDVSCPSIHLCAVVRDNPAKQVLTSARPTGGEHTWRATEIKRPSQRRARCGGPRPGPGPEPRRCPSLRAVSCPSTKLCVTVGRSMGRNVVYVSRDPTGGTSAWKRASVHADPRFGLTDVSCSSAKLCVIVDDHGRAFVGRARR
jgi:hypothetical protein